MPSGTDVLFYDFVEIMEGSLRIDVALSVFEYPDQADIIVIRIQSGLDILKISYMNGDSYPVPGGAMR